MTFKAYNQVRILESAGVTYYNFGALKQGRKKLADFYQSDKITTSQRDILEKAGCIIRGSFKEYAPELKSVMILFPMQRA